MTRNPFVGMHCFGRQITQLMRDINRIEYSLNSAGSDVDVMIIVDISGSMGSVIQTVKDQVGRIFSEVLEVYSGVRVGLMQQGVDGNSNDPTYARRALILCQPTRDHQIFGAATAAMPYASGGSEWYLNAMELAADQAAWSPGSQKLLITIGDEVANQYRNGTSNITTMARFEETIAYLQARGVISSMICPRASSWYSCQNTYTQMAEATGGRWLVAPTDEEIVAMIVAMIGYYAFSQTRWNRYERFGQRTSLGEPDGGQAVPALDAIDGAPLCPQYIRDLRAAVERIVAQQRLMTPDGAVYDWTPGSPNNLLVLALGDGAAYGLTATPSNWRRSLAGMTGSPPCDVDIGEVFECVRLLKIAAGVNP